MTTPLRLSNCLLTLLSILHSFTHYEAVKIMLAIKAIPSPISNNSFYDSSTIKPLLAVLIICLKHINRTYIIYPTTNQTFPHSTPRAHNSGPARMEERRKYEL